MSTSLTGKIKSFSSLPDKYVTIRTLSNVCNSSKLQPVNQLKSIPLSQEMEREKGSVDVRIREQI